jgi:hypothetical protein
MTHHHQIPLSVSELAKSCVEARIDSDLGSLSLSLRWPIGEVLSATASSAQLVKTGKPDASIEPGPQRAAVAPKARSGADQLKKRLLNRVFGCRSISEHPEGIGGEPVGGCFVHRSISGVGPPTDPVDQLVQLMSLLNNQAYS